MAVTSSANHLRQLDVIQSCERRGVVLMQRTSHVCYILTCVHVFTKDCINPHPHLSVNLHADLFRGGDVCQSVRHCGSDRNIQPLDWLSWDFVQAFMFPRGWTRLSLAILWTFPLAEDCLLFFVKYLNNLYHHEVDIHGFEWNVKTTTG